MDQNALVSQLPTKSYSLWAFIRAAQALDSDEHNYYEHFILTGENVMENCQAFIDPTQSRVDDEIPLSLSRDYDSLIGIADRILTTRSISVYPASNPAEVLSTSIHLTYPLDDPDNEVRIASIGFLLVN